jgi:hypothetical protein
MRLEPVTTDQGLIQPLSSIEQCRDFILHTVNKNAIFGELAQSPEFWRAVERNVENVGTALPLLNSEFARIHGVFPLDRKIDTRVLNENYRLVTTAPDVCLAPGSLVDVVSEPFSDAESSPANINSKQANQLPAFLYVRHFADGRLAVHNLLPQPVELKSILVSGDRLEEFSPLLINGHANSDKPVYIQTSVDGIRDGTLEFVSAVAGVEKTRPVEPTLYPASSLHSPLIAVTEAMPDFFETNSQGGWIVRPGRRLISGPVVVTGPLTLEPGTELLFAENAYLIVQGAFNAVGNADARIIMSASGQSWKGLYVMADSAPVRLRFVDISSTNALADGLLELTGAVTFYRADVELDDVTIRDTVAEDALNLVHSSFVLNNVVINGTRSDALDVDFSSGRINNSTFTAVGGDAVDFSGSQVIVAGVSITDVHDKGVSAGEGSTLEVVGGLIADVGVGVAAKDGSQVSIRGTHFGTFRLSTLMAYIKKNFYGYPQLEVVESRFDVTPSFVRQIGSYLSVDGEAIPEENVDVEALYQADIMKKR